MKIKNILIGIKTPKEGAREFITAMKDIQAGKRPAKKEGVYFTSLEAMRKALTPKRIELVHLIREKAPDSIYELARLSGRDIKNVQEDITLLARIGLVALSRTKTARERIIPRVSYDRLQLQIPVI